jgi:hypothetical protein
MNSHKPTLKIVIGILVIVIATSGCDVESKPKLPHGVYASSDGTYLFDFQTGGTGRFDIYLPSMRGGMRLDKSTPFSWRISNEFILVDMDNDGKDYWSIKWDEADLITRGTNTRLVKKK